MHVSQEVSQRRLRRHQPLSLQETHLQFFPLLVVLQGILLSTWMIYGMAAIIVRRADHTPPQAA
ncbi:hypothetical protein DFR67_10777 [Williamsia limnetica]|uniref:Uncharacterized protein n=1 Tax=Williamsia limnetica TaxID=882452 RepID=A0A318S0Y1_WILLI|nr:hypothetical protein DFR67_10777 [Williamsia limnetica]